MNIKELIDLDLINLELKATTKDAVIHELAGMLEQNHLLYNLEGFIDDIYERESICSTGIGFQIAIPHAKSVHVKVPSLVFGRSDEGIVYDSMDGDISKLFFMIAMPEEGINSHLKVLAMLSRRLMHEDFRDQLKEAKTKSEVLELIYTMN
jgi:fructose-specific phosphotransferase system IIA component